MGKPMLSDVQLFNLVLVEEIDAICKKYDIEYYLAGGSVIGILRHKGFIPWDDDMDLYMTRDNWLKFREAFDKEKPKDRTLECSDINPNYPNMIAKYTSSNTTAIYKNLLSGKYPAGVIVDILILDPVPGDDATQQEHLKNLLLYSEFVNRYYVFSHRFDIDVEFEKALAREAQIGHEAIVREYEREVTKYSESESDTYVLRWGGVPHKFPKDMFGTPKYLPFEGIMLPVPEKAFMYLSQLYGEDWVQLPTQEDTLSHEAVFSIERPYSSFFEEFSPHFNANSYLRNVMNRKRNRIHAGRSYRAVQDETLEFEVSRLQMRYRRENERQNLRTLYDEGKFDELQAIFDEYFRVQCSGRMLGNKYYGGVYRFFHPIYADLGDDLLWIAVELLCRQGRLYHPKRLIEACQFRNGSLSPQVAEQQELIRSLIVCIDAYEQGRYDEALEIAESGAARKPDWINFLKMQILALEKLPAPDWDRIREIVDKGREVTSADGDWLKYEADTYAQEDPDHAARLYIEAYYKTRNGSSLLAISEYFDGEVPNPESSDGEVAKAVPQAFSEVQQVYFQLLCEVADLCTSAGIPYYLAGSTALKGYLLGSLTNEATSPSIVIRVEDSLKFEQAFKEKAAPNRVLDSMLTNNHYPTFSFRYVNTQTLCLTTREMQNFACNGIYVYIGFLEHRPPTAKRRFASMLKTGWYDANCLHARTKSTMLRARIAQGVVGAFYNADKDENVGPRLFRTLVDIYSCESTEYQMNTEALKLNKLKASWVDGKQATLKVNGRAFTTFAHPKAYLRKLFGNHYRQRAKESANLSVYRVIDATIPFEDYAREFDGLMTDERFQQDVLENRMYNATNMRFARRINKEWRIALFVGEKWELEDRFAEERPQIESLLVQERYADLDDLLMPYIEHFLKEDIDIAPYFDDYLCDICEVFLYETKSFDTLRDYMSRRKALSSR